MQKSALQYGEIIFQSKVILLFLPNVLSSIPGSRELHHSEMYTIEWSRPFGLVAQAQIYSK